MMGNEWSGETGGGNTTYPLVPGHEVIGIVTAVGSAVTDFKVGDRVGFGAQGGSCHKCECCNKGAENNCTRMEPLYDPNYGGYAEHIRADSRFAFKIPDEIPSEYAAPLLCAGATVFTPLSVHKLPPGSEVGIVGIGGLGHLAVQFANKMGYRVTAISTSPSKEAEARKYGAHDFISSSDSKQMNQNMNRFALILCTVSANLDWNAYMNLVAPEGKFVLVGLPEAKIAISPFNLVGGSKGFYGSIIGGVKTIKEMLQFSALTGVRPVIELIKPEFDKPEVVNNALQRVIKNDVRFRFVMAYNK